MHASNSSSARSVNHAWLQFFCAAEEVQSVLAASGAPLVERYTHQHSMLMLEAALEKARRAHRPLIITSLGNPSNDPAQICMDPSLLNALSMQVCKTPLWCNTSASTIMSDGVESLIAT